MTEFYQLDLFAGSGSSTAVFQICPKEALNSPLHDFIELCGGIVLGPGDWDPYAISIIDIEWIQRNCKAILETVNPPDDHFHPNFIYDCYRTKTAQDLNKYLLGGSVFEPYDANLILKRQLKWKDLIIRKSTKPPLQQSKKPKASKSRKVHDVPISPELKNVEINNISASACPATNKTDEPLVETDDDDILADTKGPSVQVEISCDQELTLLNHPESDLSATTDNDDSDSACSTKSKKKSPVKTRSLSERTVVSKSPAKTDEKKTDKGRHTLVKPLRASSVQLPAKRIGSTKVKENTPLVEESDRHLSRKKTTVRAAQSRVTRKQFKTLTAPVVDISDSDGETSKSSFIASLGLVASKLNGKPHKGYNQRLRISDSSDAEDDHLSSNMNGNENYENGEIDNREDSRVEVKARDDEEQITDETTDYSSGEFNKSEEREAGVESTKCRDTHESPTKFKTVALSEKTELIISPSHEGKPCNIYQNESSSEESQEEMETIAVENQRRRAKTLRRGERSSSEDTVRGSHQSIHSRSLSSHLSNGSPPSSKLKLHANGRMQTEPRAKRVCRRNESRPDLVVTLSSSSEDEDSDASSDTVIIRKLPVRNINSVDYQVDDVHDKSDSSDIEHLSAPCPFCDFEAADPMSVIKHVASEHSKRNLYSCSACEFRGATSYDLRVHRSKIHDKED